MWAYGTLLVCPVLVCPVLVGNVAFSCPLLLEVFLKAPREGLLCENLNLLYNRSPSKGVSH